MTTAMLVLRAYLHVAGNVLALRPTVTAWLAAATTWLVLYVHGGGPLW